MRFCWSPARWFLRIGEFDSASRSTWRRYLDVQAHVLSDSARSFNSIHDRTKRCETGLIRDQRWMSDDIARQYGLDIDEYYRNLPFIGVVKDGVVLGED